MSAPAPGYALPIRTMRSDSGTGSGRSRTLWTTENSAVLAPIHSASVSAAVIVNAFSFRNSRRPTRISEFIPDLVSRNSDSSHNPRAGHPGWLRCSSLTYSRYARSSRLAIRDAPPGNYVTNHCYGTLDRRALRILQREPELLRERVDRRARALPRAFGLEAQVADAAAPRRDHAADGPEIRPVRVLLIENADDVGRDADERAQGRRRADAVLASIPRAAEHERDLLEVIDEEFLRLFVDVARAAAGEHAALGEELLQLLRERRLRDAAAADAQQLDFIVERRVLAIVERTRDVVSRRQRFVPIQLPAREADQVRRVQPGVLRVDRDEH